MVSTQAPGVGVPAASNGGSGGRRPVADDRDALTQTPNPDATVPTGMCGSPTKCEHCPSTFLCFMKAKAENDIINAREATDAV